MSAPETLCRLFETSSALCKTSGVEVNLRSIRNPAPEPDATSSPSGDSADFQQTTRISEVPKEEWQKMADARLEARRASKALQDVSSAPPGHAMLILCQLLNQWQAEDTFKAMGTSTAATEECSTSGVTSELWRFVSSFSGENLSGIDGTADVRRELVAKLTAMKRRAVKQASKVATSSAEATLNFMGKVAHTLEDLSPISSCATNGPTPGLSVCRSKPLQAKAASSSLTKGNNRGGKENNPIGGGEGRDRGSEEAVQAIPAVTQVTPELNTRAVAASPAPLWVLQCDTYQCKTPDPAQELSSEVSPVRRHLEMGEPKDYAGDGEEASCGVSCAAEELVKALKETREELSRVQADVSAARAVMAWVLDNHWSESISKHSMSDAQAVEWVAAAVGGSAHRMAADLGVAPEEASPELRRPLALELAVLLHRVVRTLRRSDRKAAKTAAEVPRINKKLPPNTEPLWRKLTRRR